MKHHNHDASFNEALKNLFQKKPDQQPSVTAIERVRRNLLKLFEDDD